MISVKNKEKKTKGGKKTGNRRVTEEILLTVK